MHESSLCLHYFLCVFFACITNFKLNLITQLYDRTPVKNEVQVRKQSFSKFDKLTLPSKVKERTLYINASGLSSVTKYVSCAATELNCD